MPEPCNRCGDREGVCDCRVIDTWRILVTGSRGWKDEARIAWELGLACGEAHHLGRQPVVIHGACPSGADAMADRLVRDYGLRVERYPAQWSLHGRSAGHRRNQQMVDLGAHVCLAFSLGNSPGTRDCIRRARAAGIPVLLIEADA